jgi:hypothetical protein
LGTVRGGQSSPIPQAIRFAEVARALGADEDEAAFRAKLAAIARQKPKDAPERPARAPKAKRKPKGG